MILANFVTIGLIVLIVLAVLVLLMLYVLLNKMDGVQQLVQRIRTSAPKASKKKDDKKLVAAITAAVAMMLEQENQTDNSGSIKADFVVKSLKKL